MTVLPYFIPCLYPFSLILYKKLQLQGRKESHFKFSLGNLKCGIMLTTNSNQQFHLKGTVPWMQSLDQVGLTLVQIHA